MLDWYWKNNTSLFFASGEFVICWIETWTLFNNIVSGPTKILMVFEKELLVTVVIRSVKVLSLKNAWLHLCVTSKRPSRGEVLNSRLVVDRADILVHPLARLTHLVRLDASTNVCKLGWKSCSDLRWYNRSLKLDRSISHTIFTLRIKWPSFLTSCL